jgi:NAD(P)-dependent dehydrogenase (short-subunit alcohol dehydrogenase family)
MEKIALITGASRGIGRAVAERLIDNGIHVIAVARTLADLERLDDYARERGSNITIVPLDISEFAKIDELGFNIFQKFGKLDIFIGNAGILGGCCPLGHYNPKVWQKVIDVNLSANWRFIRSLDPLLRRSESGTVIFVTSHMANTCDAYYGAYAASKAGLEAMAKVYENEVRNSNIKVSLVTPENVKTKLLDEAFRTQTGAGLKEPYEIACMFEELIEA